MQRLSSGSHEFRRRDKILSGIKSNSTALKEGGKKSSRLPLSNNSPSESSRDQENRLFGKHSPSNFEIEEASYKQQKGSGKRNIFGQK